VAEPRRGCVVKDGLALGHVPELCLSNVTMSIHEAGDDHPSYRPSAKALWLSAADGATRKTPICFPAREKAKPTPNPAGTPKPAHLGHNRPGCLREDVRSQQPLRETRQRRVRTQAVGSAYTCFRIFSISCSSKARMVVLVTLPAETTLTMPPIIASSDGASTTATRS